MENSVFTTSFLEKKKTIETLIEESRADDDFYIFLTAAALITTLGQLIDSTVVVIGGMLVAPILFPILSLGMGIVTSSREAISRALSILGRSIAIVFLIALVTAFLMNEKEPTQVLRIASRPELISFLIAFTSGIVGSFAWVRQSASSLPGVAIAVSLIPPLTAIGAGAALLDRDIIAGAITLFLINLLGIVFAAMVVFSLFGFSHLQKVQKSIIQEEKENEEIKKMEKEQQKEGIASPEPIVLEIEENKSENEGGVHPG